MLKHILPSLVIGWLAVSRLAGQTSCDCLAEFAFVAEKLEKEHPGFAMQVRGAYRDVYAHRKDSIEMEIRNRQPERAECVKLLGAYLGLIRDKHQRIYIPAPAPPEGKPDASQPDNAPHLELWGADTAYVRIPSFNYRLWRVLDHFYDSIIPVLDTRGNLLIDVRGNGGGGARMYMQLVKYLRKRAAHARVGLLADRGCASACEDFTLRMMREKHITTFGVNTNGCFAYGDIKAVTTPGCAFTWIITTSRFPDRYEYEYTGLPPEVDLGHLPPDRWPAEALRQLTADAPVD